MSVLSNSSSCERVSYTTSRGVFVVLLLLLLPCDNIEHFKHAKRIKPSSLLLLLLYVRRLELSKDFYRTSFLDFFLSLSLLLTHSIQHFCLEMMSHRKMGHMHQLRIQENEVYLLVIYLTFNQLISDALDLMKAYTVNRLKRCG